MSPPGLLQQVAGIASAGVGLIWIGVVITFAWYVPEAVADRRGFHREGGVLNEVFSVNSDDTLGERPGLLPELVGVFVAIFGTLGVYVVGGVGFLLAVFIGSLLESPPPSYPTLYGLGALAVLAGIAGQYYTRTRIRRSKWYRGY